MTGAELFAEKCQKKNIRKHEWFQYSAHLPSVIIMWQRQRNSRTKTCCFILCVTDSSGQGQHCQEVAFIVQEKDELTRTLSRWQIDTQNTVDNQWQEAWVARSVLCHLRTGVCHSAHCCFQNSRLPGTSAGERLLMSSQTSKAERFRHSVQRARCCGARRQPVESRKPSLFRFLRRQSTSQSVWVLVIRPFVWPLNLPTHTHIRKHTEHSQKKRWARGSVNWKQEIKWDGTEAEVLS